MAYALLIFDFDGTLADSADWVLQSINAAAAQHGFRPVDPQRLDDYRAMPPRALMRELAIPMWKLPSITLGMRRAMAQQLDRIRLFDGAAEMLAGLRRHGIRTAVVSSNSQENVERVLGLKYASMIDHYACGASLFGKRRLMRAALRAFDIAPARVLCIGDEIRDAEAAAGAGLDFIGVAWGYATAAALAAHSRRPPFQSFDEILPAVLADA